MAPDVDAALLSRLSERGAQERSVLRVMPAARQADLTGPRVALALSTFAEEDLETFGAFPQDDHHRGRGFRLRSEEHTSELQSHLNLVCRLLLLNQNLMSLINFDSDMERKMI